MRARSTAAVERSVRWDPIRQAADTGAALTAGDGCVTSAGGAVRCTRVDGGVRVHAGDGDDRIEALEVSGRYSGDDGADVIVARGLLLGGPGHDRLTGVGFDARVAGDEGNDVLSAIDAPVPLPAGSENDVVLVGEPGDDNIRGGTGMATIYGGDGNDNVRGARGQSAIYGGAGHDDLRGADYIKGEAGNDRILGTTSRDRLRGGPGADVISGGAGSDDLRGDHGPDRISAADGERDGVDCGAGRDRSSQTVRTATSAVSRSAGEGGSGRRRERLSAGLSPRGDRGSGGGEMQRIRSDDGRAEAYEFACKRVLVALAGHAEYLPRVPRSDSENLAELRASRESGWHLCPPGISPSGRPSLEPRTDPPDYRPAECLVLGG